MNSVVATDEFEEWFDDLADDKAKEAIAARIVRLEGGLLGDCKPLARGVSEMRVHYGPGYRIYFTIRRRTIFILLCGGTKGDQRRDLKRAIGMAAQV